MGVSWTKEQLQVIETRDSNILVSAAAGSGKTAVLVERIIARLTTDPVPLDVDKLLVVTYTEAAAAEMKERIRDAIEKALEEEPDNVHLQRQATLVHNAQVTTIHSFCLSVIREHFHTIDLDPGFRIAEEGELKLLKQDVADALLEEKYAEGREEFHRLTECLAPGRDDHKLIDQMLKIYEFSRSYPDPEEWLRSCADMYELEDGIEAQPFWKCISKQAHQYAADMEALNSYALTVCREEGGPLMYEEALDADAGWIRKLEKAESFEEIYDVLSGWKWARLSTKKSPETDEEKKEEVKAVREEVKSLKAELTEQYFYLTKEEMEADMKAVSPVMKEFTELVIAFYKAIEREKASRNMIDFGDMEHFALKILTRKEDGVLKTTAAAKSYQERYEEIMIDEYQDSNLIQEALLTSVSKVEKGFYNIFMVGDVKQSIYRFRLARPELFMEKFHSYDKGEKGKQRIDLSRNFRSRREVLESTNFIFRQIMTTGLGGIAYDDRAALYTGASYEDIPGNEAELILVETDGSVLVEDEAESGKAVAEEIGGNRVARIGADAVVMAGGSEKESQGERTSMTDEEQLEATSRELEAYAIAARIKELVGTHPILDKKTGEYRPAKYGDIVILTRSLKGWTEDFSNILNKEGIPTFSGTKEGYFETWEVSTVLDYLNLLDNQRQDLPMASVLLSPFVGMKAEELAKIRANAPDVQFFEAVFSYKDTREAEPEVCRKLDIFQKQYEGYRKILPYTSIHDLLWKLLEETGYRDYVGAMPGGRQRQANLDMLVEKAIAFESTSYKGLFHFVRYIRQLQKYDVDYGEANISDEQADTVRLMSIHKSKGLEFPIVFAAGMGKQFNTQDIRDQLVVHPELGIGMDAIDLILRTKTPTLLKKVLQKETALENLAEEQRVLYVALTRAKEKLIITGAVKDVKKKLAAYGVVRARRERELSFAGLSRAKTYLDWIIPALIRHNSFADILAEYDMQVPFTNPIYKEEVPIKEKIVRPEELLQGALEEETAGNLLTEFLKYRIDSGETFHKEMQKQMEKQFAFSYPFSKDRTRKLKFTVSELKKMQYPGEEEESEVLFEEPEEEKLVPKFMRDDTPLTGTSRGTAYHRVMELLDFTQEYDRESLAEAVKGFEQSGRLTKEGAKSVKIADLEAFFRTDIAKRMRKAARLGKLWKEQPFVIGLEEDGEMILVQGIIDAYIEEDGKLTVIDYKTDHVKSVQELKDKYHRQLEYYAQALGQMLCGHSGISGSKKVEQKMLYSFALRKEIEV